jgi:hypothetical protein
MPQIIFLDTEFTSLSEPYLVSAGMVDEHGRELYLELEGISPEICSPFVVEHVLPLLDGPELRPADFARRICDFLCRYTDLGSSVPGRPLGDAGISLFCDAPRYDIELLKPFLPSGLRWEMAVPSFDSEPEENAFRREQEAAYAGGLRRHHALDDARALRRAWQALHPPPG